MYSGRREVMIEVLELSVVSGFILGILGAVVYGLLRSPIGWSVKERH
jgi:hypothetical protein